MELQALIGTFRRRWITLVVVTAVTLAVAYVVTRVTPATYTATARDFVSIQGTDTVGDLLQGSNFARQQTQSYAALVDTPLVLDPVIDELGLPITSGELAERVTGTADDSTTLVTIAVTANSAEESADIANAVARQLDQAVRVVNAAREGAFETRITVVSPATVPQTPTSPNRIYNLAIGLVLGLVLGAAAALGRDLLDGRVRDVTEVRRTTSMPLLASLSHTRRLGDWLARRPWGRLAASGARPSRSADDFRRLRTAVQAMPRFSAEGPHVLAVVSPRPGDGRTTTAVNLARALAETGARVSLVDGNFHTPGVAQALDVTVLGDVGWASILSDGRPLDEVIIQVDGSLSVVPAGSAPTNPAGLLSSPAAMDSLQNIAASAEWVVVDTPSMLTASDAAILARLVDGVILVVDIGTTRQRDVSAAMALLQSVGANVIGVVANRT